MGRALILGASVCVCVCMCTILYHAHIHRHTHPWLVNGGIYYMPVVASLPDYWLDTNGPGALE